MRTEFWAVAAEQAAGVGVFFAAYFVSGYLPMGANIALSVIVGIGAFVGYLVCNHKDFLDGLWLFPLLFSAATGFAGDAADGIGGSIDFGGGGGKVRKKRKGK